DVLEVGDEFLLDAKDRVFTQIWTVWGKDMRDHWLMAWCGHDEMKVSGTVGMTPELFQELAYRPIRWNRIVAWLDRSKPIPPFLVCAEDSSKVALRLNAFLLNIVEAIVVGLPCIDSCAGNRPALGVDDLPAYDQWLALSI